MEDTTRPPVRIQANASSSLSLKATKSHLDEFLIDFHTRSTPSKGGDTTITAQLEKLSKSLKEQRARERQIRRNRWYSHTCFTLYTRL
ncbi:hypothetical protein EV363DRAFT_1465357 [Boletus edulis]|nr:hypothetical protein EV363DRAFT_1465357 [Boletus edulis]